MIPALMGRKKAVGIILGGLRGEEDKAAPEAESADGLKMAADDLIRAVEGKDASAVADALRAAFNVLEAEEVE